MGRSSKLAKWKLNLQFVCHVYAHFWFDLAALSEIKHHQEYQRAHLIFLYFIQRISDPKS